MNTETSNHLKGVKKIHVDILSTAGNCTVYVIRETQGAEYGQEAESVRQRFEASMKSYGITISEATLEAFQQFLDDECGDMDREDYRDLLHEVVGECKARLSAMDEEDNS